MQSLEIVQVTYGGVFFQLRILLNRDVEEESGMELVQGFARSHGYHALIMDMPRQSCMRNWKILQFKACWLMTGNDGMRIS